MKLVRTVLAALSGLSVLAAPALAQLNDMKVYPMTTTEQGQLDAQARRFMGRECAGSYGQLIYPMASEAMTASMITELGVKPELILGRGPNARGQILKYIYAVGKNAEGRFALRLRRGGPVTFQYYRSTTRNGQFVVIKQACTLR